MVGGDGIMAALDFSGQIEKRVLLYKGITIGN